MPISNLNNTHLDPIQIQTIERALDDLERALQPLTINLSPDERKQYGRVNEQNKLIIDRVYSFYNSNPQLARPDIDWGEFLNDYNSRRTMERFMNRIDGLRARFLDAKTLHDFDNYNNAIDDYGYTSYMASSSTPGYQAKFEELKQFFTRRVAKPEKKDASKTTNDPSGTSASGSGE
ncbi:MAG: hypothetical protein EOP52_00185 [Sphingobacteriales bacterium]|nr:MAG: hypothetical protein EOP52_00185 [Sphingobacteriales bacterium]